VTAISPEPSAVSRLYADLRRRKVLRVLAVYLVGAWVVLQVADVAVLPAFGIPDIGIRYLVIAAIVGFCVALALSWRYQVTPRGLLRQPSGTADEGSGNPLHGSDWLVIGVLAVTALLALGGAVTKLSSMANIDAVEEVPSQAATVPVAAPPYSLAVMPFANLSDDPDLEYFADGLAEEILNRLSTVSSLQVTARTSAFSFKGRGATVQEIGKALGVANILEGSVRRSGDSLRMTVQLVNTGTGYRIWSATYDRKFDDVFAMQDEISQAVISKLQVALKPEEKTYLSAHGTQDPEVFDLYLRARQLYQRMDIDGLDKGIRHLDEVIARDPSFAQAYVALADALMIEGQMTRKEYWEDPNSRFWKLLEKAIELDPRNADAYAIRSNVRWTSDIDGARRDVELAEKLNPNGELVLRYIGQFYANVEWPPAKALDYMLRGQQLDPLNPWAITNVAIAYGSVGEFAKSLEECDRALELNPTFWVAWWQRDGMLIQLGRFDEAVDAARKALEYSNGYVDLNADLIVALAGAGRVAEAQALFAEMEDPARNPKWASGPRIWALAALGRHEDAMKAMEAAFDARQNVMGLPPLDDPAFVPLHNDPRFKRIVHALGQDQRVERMGQRVLADRSVSQKSK
jgi:TolB-like protein/Tfp pilus assembly protein PilF